MNMPRSPCEASPYLMLLVAVWSACLLPLGCNGNPLRGPQDLLFTPEGRERGDPSNSAYMALLAAKGQRREGMINALVDRVDARGGYSRLVAADVLLRFFASHPEAMSERAAHVLAGHTVCVATPPGDHVFPDFMVLAPNLEEYYKGLVYLLDPKFEMRVDDRFVRLGHPLAPGWQIVGGTVELDGKTIVRKQSPATQGGVAYITPVRMADHLKGSDLYGKHAVRAGIIVEAPNGTEVPLEVRWEFEVLTDEDFDRRFRHSDRRAILERAGVLPKRED